MIQLNTITGVILAYAGGRASVGQAQAAIDQQGNFSIPVSPQPAIQSVTLTPPQGSPYSPLVLSVALVPGITNITTQIDGALTTLGTFLGIPSAQVIGTDVRGFAIAESGGSGVSQIVAGSNVTIFPSGGTGAVTINASGGTSLPANQLDIAQAPYYASTAGATTTTTVGSTAPGSSVTVASSATWLAGHGICIPGAGAAGAAYVGAVTLISGSVFTVSPATSTTVANGTLVQHDCTAAFLAALAALATTGGTIWVPDGIYLVNGPLLDTGGANAILPMPVIANYTSPLLDISIKGYTLPNWGSSLVGTTISTAKNTGNLFGGYDSSSGGGYPNFTNVKLHLEQITLQGPANPGIVMVNASNLLAFSANHVLLTAPGGVPSNAAGAGILMPEVANEIQNEIHDVQVGGFYTGYRLGEHTWATKLEATTCVNGVVFDVGTNVNQPVGYLGNSISIGYMHVQECTHGIVGGANATVVNIQNASMELNGTDIIDSGNKLYGVINCLSPYSPYLCTVSGGTNVRINQTINGNGGNFNLIADKLLAAPAATVSFSAIPQYYRHLRLMIQARSDDPTTDANVGLYMQANGDTGANYQRQFMLGVNSTLVAGNEGSGAQVGVPIPSAMAFAGSAGSIVIDIPNYTGSTFIKSATMNDAYGSGRAFSLIYLTMSWAWNNTAAIAQLTFGCAGSNLVAGSRFTLYGLN